MAKSQATRKLKLVEDHFAGAGKPITVDIYAKWRAEIEARDFTAVHISGDRRAPVDLPDGRKRTWTK